MNRYFGGRMKHFWKLCTVWFALMGVVSLAGAVPIAEQWKGTTLRSPRHFHEQKGIERDLSGFGWETRSIDVDSSHSYDALHLDILLEPDLDARTLLATVTLTAMSEVESLSQIDVHLEYGTIHSVLFGETAAEYEYSGGVVLVTLPTAVPSGEEFAVTINYSVNFRANNDYNGGIYYSNLSDVLYTFGEPYGTRRWLACYDLPFDKVTSTLSAILPSDYLLASNGELEGVEDLGNGTSRTTWENNHPISTYLIAFCASPYVRVEAEPAGINDTPIAFWVYPNDEADMVYDFGRTGEMLELYESQFGTYPFNKYDQAAAPIFGGWGAMEHQSCTTFGAGLVGDGTRQFEWIVAHELAHQWWGDWVGPVDFANIWLNEGFATYSEVLWAETQSQAMVLSHLSGLRQSYFNEDSNYRFPIYDPPYNPEAGIDFLFSSTVYDKGGLILHMLRWVMRDDNFFAGLQHYGENHAYGSANTAELQEDMESVSGMDLTDFFDQWIYGQGFPHFQIGQFSASVDEETGNTASLRINQVQSNAPLFSTPLPILFRAGAVDTLVRVEIEALESQVVTIGNLEFLPTQFSYDPYMTILSQYSTLDVSEGDKLPVTFEVTQPWPNPFNAATRIGITLVRPAKVRMEVFDLLGRQVGVIERGVMTAGNHQLNWEPASELSSGIYLLRLKVGDEQTIRRATLIK